mmetsp:Transcript_27180/g.58239  ORF Transcript_27180/g.58239 Transcript_27180/m.58239 type:complete len:94 (+) Transcript_27180:1205-1486(+)|eukprot:CAMPEP_0172329786 /NCGR_PEP_ID=MMETSP1058-20130122/61060_1 /TAXON_ID=83371 /ORGANISM="Detonula confervacea, Strain CCMP 353" /LENGTH=93 /DNA_ID=CAMNT_0013046977 /DNA_START=2596 /DNA_END=2877 /DNA_ORIENTATION=-
MDLASFLIRRPLGGSIATCVSASLEDFFSPKYQAMCDADNCRAQICPMSIHLGHLASAGNIAHKPKSYPERPHNPMQGIIVATAIKQVSPGSG